MWKAGADDWEPAIAADPSAPYVYSLSTRYTGPARCPSCPSPSIVLRVSADGGRTWGPDRFLCVCKAIEHGQYDPQIVVDAEGTVFAAWLEGFQPGVSVSKSTDHGRTWTTPVSMPSAWSDKPWLAVSPSGQDVYVAYNGPSHGDSFVGVSHDGGASFVTKKITDKNRYFFAGGGWVSADGRHIAFAESDYDQRSAAQIHSDVVLSDDGGATWQVIRVATGDQQPDCTSDGCYDGFYGPTPTLTADANGDLLFVYAANDADRAPQQVFATTSSDGGHTWATPTALSPPGADAIFPAAVSGGPGDFRVWWMDTRTGRWNVWYSRYDRWRGHVVRCDPALERPRRGRLQRFEGVPGGLRRLRRDRHHERREGRRDLGRGRLVHGTGRGLVRSRTLVRVRPPCHGAPDRRGTVRSSRAPRRPSRNRSWSTSAGSDRGDRPEDAPAAARSSASPCRTVGRARR